jgi:hypothetical protein
VTDSDLLTRWSIGMAAAIVIVLVVAVLLLLIINQAKGILAAAARCLAAVRAIRPNVEPIWQLETTNRVAEQLVAATQSIEGKAALLADTLAAEEASRVSTSPAGR